MQPLLLGAFMLQLLTSLAFGDSSFSVQAATTLTGVCAGLGGWYIGRTREPAATVLVACAIPFGVGAFFQLWTFLAAGACLSVGFFLARSVCHSTVVEALESSECESQASD
jgi:hypothetical protein